MPQISNSAITIGMTMMAMSPADEPDFKSACEGEFIEVEISVSYRSTHHFRAILPGVAFETEALVVGIR